MVAVRPRSVFRTPGCFQQHDVLRAYAAELSAREADDEDALSQSHVRLVRWHVFRQRR